MSKGRWQHIDRKPPAPAEASPAVSAAPADVASAVASDAAPAPDPVLVTARGYYRLRHFEACAELLSNPEVEAVPGVLRLLGIALGRSDDPAGAVRALTAALAMEPADVELRASLLSAQLQVGEVPEASTFNLQPLAGPLGELSGAAAWVRGQAQLREGRAAEAAASFAEAGALFSAHSPAAALPERIAASYVAEAVSRLLAGHWDAAQQGFSRLTSGPTQGGARRPMLTRAVVDFARQLYEVTEAARALPDHEREAALQPLGELVLRARLRVRFYDGEQPVAMFWEGFL